MAVSINRVTLGGRLGADPEEKGRDDKFAVFNMATSEKWRDRESGEMKERTQWHRVVVYNKPASKFALQYLKKGDNVLVEGTLEHREYDDGGTRKYITEVVVRSFGGFVQSAGKGSGGGRAEERDNTYDEREDDQSGGFGNSGGGRSMRDVIDDEIPF
jgi:single-strand DNA-binding protein